MKRLIGLAGLLLLAGLAFSQQPAANSFYTQRALELIGLEQNEISQILRIQEEAASEIRSHQADQDIKKAELARLLLEEDPNMRLVERNLRETASIEVEIRMVEIRREYAIRSIVGTDRWARILQTIRARRDQAATDAAQAASAQLQQLQQALAEKQRQLTDLLQNNRDVLSDEEVRRQFQELQQQYQELQRLIRERL
jgi:hypothetical protein